MRGTSVGAPLLAVQSLRGADGVDNTAAKILLQQALKLKKEEEEEEEEEEKKKERRRKREEAQHEARMLELDRRVFRDEQLTPAESYAWRKWAGHLPSEPRRKKKRKKKKLPRAPRPRQCCRRPCDHQRQVPAVRIPVMMQRQVPTVHSFLLPVQFLDTVLDMPVVVLRQVRGSTVQKTGLLLCARLVFAGYDTPRVVFPLVVAKPKMLCILARMDQIMVQTAETVESPQLQSIQVVDISFVAQRQFPLVQTIQLTIEISLSFVFGGRCPRYAGRAVSQVPPWRRHSCSHSCSSCRFISPSWC